MLLDHSSNHLKDTKTFITTWSFLTKEIMNEIVNKVKQQRNIYLNTNLSLNSFSQTSKKSF